MARKLNVNICSPTVGFVPPISLPAKEPVNAIPGTAPARFARMSSPLEPQNSGKRRANVNNEQTRTSSVGDDRNG
jgi:hypothetical protein